MTYKLLSKRVLRVTNDPETFLNALTTNMLDKPKNAFLDRFGKCVAFFHQVKHQDAIYIVIERTVKERLLYHLQNYLKLSKTKIEETPLKAIHCIGKNLPKGIAIPESYGIYILTEKLPDEKELSDEEYLKIRVENNIPLQGIDFNHEMFLEINQIDAVSFTKGCYLGQEIIARVHSRGKPIKKLVRIVADKQLAVITSEGEELGTVTSSCYSEKQGKYLHLAMIKGYEKRLDEGKAL